MESLRPGVRIAFDPERRRVWTVCDRCHGWSLWPHDERTSALERLERTAHRARLLYQTANVALLEANGRELVRVGRPELPEEAWWRYGRELRRRQTSYRSRLSAVGAAAYAAISYLGANVGLQGITGDFHLEEDLYAGVLRWRRFGRTAWSGRAPCPNCRSVLLKLFYFRTRYLVLMPGSDGGLAIGLPCSRCDPWTEEKVHRLEGPAAERVLRRVLAYQNVKGASEHDLADAVGTIEKAGSARRLVSDLATDRTPLYELDRSRALALEISVNDSVERRQLAIEGAVLEEGWRRAEEVAAIIDEEL
ncbi:MAG: hypothetical protein GWN99_09135 [Gemmatimonadetes bacterium]|uniref:Uncharacterized protein n=1 Tax=Candidatus Kutchimonas denitrificans TaxID=3056748 RepID=A0AAE5CCZ9_9BACT|nr:hypothetical protein [Gemmatimonadota bacterium]NIR76728.1 hypothetical protein [Candidatus Kutchimonas denitrificans]NIS01215.1 hypothetical protein [Gemmatimonadota bacterium]NIT68254.1 hypothetical protein [Gemmatimonadota bacterium]NIW75472.1 hypothetical protein [Gemmatimonadota bacterium]